ncbi:hypothetical protein, partial [Pseudomonas syringae]|uniref:hypothetical protein n=1 Tax=Pseudomonas syringae TaxID=317 RepID=UPI001F1E27A9
LKGHLDSVDMLDTPFCHLHPAIQSTCGTSDSDDGTQQHWVHAGRSFNDQASSTDTQHSDHQIAASRAHNVRRKLELIVISLSG